MRSIEPEVVVAALTGEATEEQVRRLDEWRAAAVENERAYRRWVRVWAVSGQFLGEDRRPDAPSAEEIISLAEARSADVRAVSVPTCATRRRRIVAAAAILVLGLGIGALGSLSLRESPLLPRMLETSAGEVATVTLADGTIVHLAPQSRLEFVAGRAEREVSLVGRAYFAVTSDPSRPFRVRLPNGTIQVLGTRFDVDNRGEDVQVAVVEGVVEMEAGGGRARVEANQLGVALGRDAPTVQPVDDVFEVINWLGRFLAFESTPIGEVAIELERRFDLRIVIADQALETRTVTGWFGDQSATELLQGICAAVAARCVVGNGVTTMEAM